MKTSGIDSLVLLPGPRYMTSNGGSCVLPDRQLIVLNAAKPHRLRFTARRFQRTLQERLGLSWTVTASSAVSDEKVGLRLSISPEILPQPQGYRLSIDPEGIKVEAPDEAGVFYAVCTLNQIVAVAGRHLPGLEITDWPDFPARGVMLDVSRDKVPTMETLLALVDMLAGWKVNQLQLYMEHTFAYHRHPEIWADASPFTAQEIIDLDIYCRQRHIELVPNQNSFGHMHHWLKHPRYRPLAECPDGAQTPWGTEPFTLCPLDPGSFELVESLYDELLPNFTSRMFNVGCDETFELGQGRSAEACQQRGTGRVYLDFLLRIYAAVKERGLTMQFWGDIIIQHPELVPDLPRDVIALEWGYEADHPFDDNCARFAAAEIPFYVCPGTSSWNTLAGRTDNALRNLFNAAENGLKHGAIGYLNTDWGDYGHWQVLPISYLGFAAGAAYSWCLDSNQDIPLSQALSTHAFGDPTGSLGEVAYDLGNVYRSLGFEPPNASPLFGILRYPIDPQIAIPKEGIQNAFDSVNRAIVPLEFAQWGTADAWLVQQEFSITARLLRHACQRGLLAHERDPQIANQMRAELYRDFKAILETYKEIWSQRNRPGGLSDSLSKLQAVVVDYQ
jgi:hypothetical protein